MDIYTFVYYSKWSDTNCEYVTKIFIIFKVFAEIIDYEGTIKFTTHETLAPITRNTLLPRLKCD